MCSGQQEIQEYVLKATEGATSSDPFEARLKLLPRFHKPQQHMIELDNPAV
jgi:hypothetical protein